MKKKKKKSVGLCPSIPTPSSSFSLLYKGFFLQTLMAQPTVVAVISVFILSHSFISGVQATTFTIVNKCDYVVWPGILSNAGVPTLSTTGFTLQSGETKTITPPTSWGGRFWGRTHCSQDSTGKFSCLTGDCGSGKLECSGNGASPPATLAEFTLDGAGGFDFYDVSLVDGYNIPMLVVPQGGTGQNCTYTGCVADLNDSCPSELKVMSTDSGDGVACKSACEAFRQPQYCCTGQYGTPDTCKPSSYSEIFKTACPQAYSYAYDDLTSTCTCANADYIITFCPSPNTSQKSSRGQNTTTTTTSSLTNSTMVYQGASDDSAASSATCTHVFGSHAIAGIVGITLAIWWS
ncbi:thaumatin-like protein 1b [Durio zibethinus]|uniref:Thaumatin-like protein 1b n=1 Tax=Durio zibethinus TaxID=66656 RepID=A0A6P5ZQB9_DURZI|nr:thaumatin-like protein 1b [Durio zibethinus]